MDNEQRARFNGNEKVESSNRSIHFILEWCKHNIFLIADNFLVLAGSRRLAPLCAKIYTESECSYP